MTEEEYRVNLKKQIKDAYGKVTYTYTTQWKQHNIFVSRSHGIKVLEIAISAATTTGLVGALICDNRCAVVISALLSAISLAIMLYTKEIKYDVLIASHRSCANDLWLLRERYISLLTDFENLSLDEIQKIRDELTSSASQLYKVAPATTPKAYKKAQKALKNEEEQFFTDDEIDMMLPPHLRTKV